MPVTAKETCRVEFGMDDRTTLHVPGPPASLVTHVTSGLAPFQSPRTVTPFTGLCRLSCAVICTVADQAPVLPLVSAAPPRFPTWRLGGLTLITVALALLPELASASFCVAVTMCPLSAAPAVFQVNVRVALAPMASPEIVWVPSTALPAVPSVS